MGVSICLNQFRGRTSTLVTFHTVYKQKTKINMSADLYWMVVRDTSSFMMKGRLSKGKVFSKDPMNLTGLHSLTSSGIVGPKAVGITAAPDNKGVVVVTKKPKAVSKPGQSTTSVTLKKGRRAVIKSVANSVSAFNKTKKHAAMKRASAILRSQRPRIGKKTKKEYQNGKAGRD